MAQFEPAVLLTLQFEGGFNHFKTGEVVNHGITLKTLRSLGILKTTGPTLQSDIEFVKGLAVEDAKDIYHSVYWTPLLLDQVTSQSVANKVFDLAVNTGPGEAAICLQHAINETATERVKVDASIGPKTIAAANAVEPIKLLGARSVALIGTTGQLIETTPGSGIRGAAEQFYRSLRDSSNLHGWLARLDA